MDAKYNSVIIYCAILCDSCVVLFLVHIINGKWHIMGLPKTKNASIVIKELNFNGVKNKM